MPHSDLVAHKFKPIKDAMHESTSERPWCADQYFGCDVWSTLLLMVVHVLIARCSLGYRIRKQVAVPVEEARRVSH